MSSSANHLSGKEWEFGEFASDFVTSEQGGMRESYLTPLEKGGPCNKPFQKHKGGGVLQGHSSNDKASVKFNLIRMQRNLSKDSMRGWSGKRQVIDAGFSGEPTPNSPNFPRPMRGQLAAVPTAGRGRPPFVRALTAPPSGALRGTAQSRPWHARGAPRTPREAGRILAAGPRSLEEC